MHEGVKIKVNTGKNEIKSILVYHCTMKSSGVFLKGFFTSKEETKTWFTKFIRNFFINIGYENPFLEPRPHMLALFRINKRNALKIRKS